MSPTLAESLADRYRIGRTLGAGGMATVYLAEDLRHHRRVAIKVLHEELGAAVGLERFQQEIEVTARLQHPHILPLFDSGSANGRLYYVMPYVEGETLRQRLDGERQLPLDEALRIAGEVADALHYAHRHGVVHRDIKPENILLHDGHAVVADFGIALAVQEAGDRLTQTGISVGTPGYMSPEQASGERVLDARSDIYALGAVTYEMLAGTPPHTGPTAQATIARIVTEQATPLSVLRPGTPRAVEAAVARALAKVPGDRFASASEFGAALRAANAPGTTPGGDAASSGRRWMTAALVVTVVAVAALAVAKRQTSDSEAPVRPGTVTHLTRDPGLELDPALSPDGVAIAYVAGPPGDMRVYVRQVAEGRVIAVAESLADHQRLPRWSPDGTRLVFQAGHAEYEDQAGAPPNALYVVPALGGLPRRLVANDSASAFAPEWSPDGTRIAFVSGSGVYGSRISLVDASGETPPVALADARLASALRWSPDGSMIAYVVGNPRFALGTAHLGNDGPSSIHVLTLADKRTHVITDSSALNASPNWTRDGRSLLFVSNREGSRDVYRIGVGRDGEAQGGAERLTTGLSAHAIDLSRDGRTLAYAAYTPYAHLWAAPLAATKSTTLFEATQVTIGAETVEGFALSKDGRWLAYDSDRSGNGDVWTIAVTGGTPRQVTTDPSGDYVQDWSPDGRELAIHSFRTGARQVFVVPSTGGPAQRVATTTTDDANPDFSPDGNAIAFDNVESTGTQISVARRTARGAPWGAPRRITTRGGSDPSWSPDGRWIAYISRGVRIVSPSGDGDRLVVPGAVAPDSVEPRFAYWSADGGTLYYKAYDARDRSSIWSVALTGGAPRLVIRFDDPARPSPRREMATDGTRLYFTIADHESDIWLMELRP